MTPRDGEPTRLAILAAASDLLELGGPDAVTLRAVGEAAGVSRSAPYRHFSDKHDLLAALGTSALESMAVAVRAAAGREGDPHRALLAGARAYVRSALDRPHHYLLVFGSTPLQAPTPSLERAADDAMASLRELVEAAHPSASAIPAPARELATVLWVQLHGLASLQITGHFHEPRTIDGETRLDELLTLSVESLLQS